jgi:phosphonopyruvate decarboxylase
MLTPEWLYDKLGQAGVGFYAGVPDSLLKDFCAYVTAHTPPERNVIAANEGNAVALAMGHHLATGGIGLVYLQNSGLGNTVNPLTSLADPAVYSIPMLLLVGWRGEPGVPDEPQHVHMGRVTLATLGAIGMPHVVLPADPDDAEAVLGALFADVRAKRAPHAIVVRKGTFAKYALPEAAPRYRLTREQAIARFVEALEPDAVVVATTGMPSRELFELRRARGEPGDADFLTVGGMGHASQIALGIALARADRPLYCLDGDGAVLMHMGGLGLIGQLAPPRYKHVVLNNGAHDSVGGQPTVAFEVDLCAVARACGYRSAERAEDDAGLVAGLAHLKAAEGPALLEARLRKGHRADLGRPTRAPAEAKEAFMGALGANGR